MNKELTKYIKICLIKKEMSISELARKTNQSRQSLCGKLDRGVFKLNDLSKIANALDCDLNIEFIDRSTGGKL